MSKNVFGIKFTNGFEMIGKFEQDSTEEIVKALKTDGYITMYDAVGVQPKQVGEGQYDIEFYPISFMAKFSESVAVTTPVLATAVWAPYQPADNLATRYSAYLSPIVIADATGQVKR